jgi:hypothetical protein
MIIGWIMLVQTTSIAIVRALGSSESLVILNRFCWLSLAVAVAASGLFSMFGLVGIIAGVGLAYVVLTAAGTRIARELFRVRDI